MDVDSLADDLLSLLSKESSGVLSLLSVRTGFLFGLILLQLCLDLLASFIFWC